MRVGDICNLDVRSCSPETHLAAVASIMLEQDLGCIPVVNRANRVVGVLTDRDICMALAKHNLPASEVTAGQVVAANVHTCRLDDDVRAALRTMRTYRVRRLPVVGFGNQLLGIFSLTDLILATRDPKLARPGDTTWGDVMPSLDLILRPSQVAPPFAFPENPEVLLASGARS